MDWDRKWLVDFSAGNTELVSFDQSNNTGAIDVKMDGSVLEELNWFHILILDGGLLVILIYCIYSDIYSDFSVTIPRCYKDVYVKSLFLLTARLRNLLPIKCFPLTYDLNGFKYRINRHLSTAGSF